MSNNLKVQSFYHIELDRTWENKKYDIQIVGMSSISNVNELDPTVNIKKEFFTDYDLGISKYLMLITDSTIIYVARPIKTYDPKVIDEDKKIFIPETLIDYSRTFEYQEAKKYNFDVSTGIKKFDNILDESDFLDKATTDITKAINNVDNFISDTVSVAVKPVEVLTTKSVLTQLDRERQELIIDRDNSIKQSKTNTETMERNLYNSSMAALEAKEEYVEKKLALESQIDNINEMQLENEKENEILKEIKIIMTEMINEIRNGEFLPESFPTFDELYDKVKGELYPDG